MDLRKEPNFEAKLLGGRDKPSGITLITWWRYSIVYVVFFLKLRERLKPLGLIAAQELKSL